MQIETEKGNTRGMEMLSFLNKKSFMKGLSSECLS